MLFLAEDGSKETPKAFTVGTKFETNISPAIARKLCIVLDMIADDMVAIDRSIQLDDFSLAVGIVLSDFLVGLGSNEFFRFTSDFLSVFLKGFQSPITLHLFNECCRGLKWITERKLPHFDGDHDHSTKKSTSIAA